MKCYCYDTELEFVLCVENADITLEDAIQHAWFKKTDKGFAKTYPNIEGNGVSKEDKELVSKNFAHLGQSMFEGMLNCNWKNALLLFAQKCKENGIEYYIFGSVSDAVHGVNINPHDIDIVIHTRDFYKLKSIFPDSIVEPFVDNKETWLVRYFGRLCFAGVLFDIVADEKMNLENHQYDKVLWNSYDLYAESLQVRYQLELKRNREDRIKAIEEFMMGSHPSRNFLPEVF